MPNYPRLVIGVNGPPGIGKTWLCLRLSEIFRDRSNICHITDPIRAKAMADSNWDLSMGTYIDFKNHVFEDGTTGRDRMIRLGTQMRERHGSSYWNDILVNSVIFSHSEIVLIDDIGFQDEVHYFDNRYPYIQIVISPPEYTIGEHFLLNDGIGYDSRVRVHHNHALIATSSNDALAFLEKEIEQFRSGESVSPSHGWDYIAMVWPLAEREDSDSIR